MNKKRKNLHIDTTDNETDAGREHVDGAGEDLQRGIIERRVHRRGDDRDHGLSDGQDGEDGSLLAILDQFGGGGAGGQGGQPAGYPDDGRWRRGGGNLREN